jgi:site-specific recombinase XerD
VEDETGDDRPTNNASSIDVALAASLRTLSGANKSAATITTYCTDLTQFLTYLHQTNCAIDVAGDIARADAEEYLAHLASRA